MKEIYKDPLFYYVLVPVVVGLWPLLVGVVFLPSVQANWEKQKSQYNKSQKIIKQILTIDPDRLDYDGSKKGESEFDYSRAVDKVASSCGISPANYNISSRPVRSSGGQKSQSAMVILKDVGVTSFAEFLSKMQLRWENLQCEKVKLTKKKGLKDVWKIDVDLKYYY